MKTRIEAAKELHAIYNAMGADYLNPAKLKGMAKHSYNRLAAAMDEDNAKSLFNSFCALTDNAKAIVLAAGHFSNYYINGEGKEMVLPEAAKELTERAAAKAGRITTNSLFRRTVRNKRGFAQRHRNRRTLRGYILTCKNL